MKRAARREGEHEKREKEKNQEAHLQCGQCDEEESLASFGLEGQISVFKNARLC